MTGLRGGQHQGLRSVRVRAAREHCLRTYLTCLLPRLLNLPTAYLLQALSEDDVHMTLRKGSIKADVVITDVDAAVASDAAAATAAVLDSQARRKSVSSKETSR